MDAPALAGDAQSPYFNMGEVQIMTRKLEHPSGPKTPEEKQRDNRANQLNPDNWRFWKARGLDKPPEAAEPPHRKIGE